MTKKKNQNTKNVAMGGKVEKSAGRHDPKPSGVSGAG